MPKNNVSICCQRCGLEGVKNKTITRKCGQARWLCASCQERARDRLIRLKDMPPSYHHAGAPLG